MDQELKLNERPYRIFDTGEGKCTVLITSASSVMSLERDYLHLTNFSKRLIIIDISSSISNGISTLNGEDIETLVDDLGLLLDIFWLEGVCIEIDGKCERLSQRLSCVLGVSFVKSVG